MSIEQIYSSFICDKMMTLLRRMCISVSWQRDKSLEHIYRERKKIKGISTISGREHLQAPTTTHGSINWHMLHSRHPSTTLIHQVHPRPGSIQLLQLMMVSAMQRQDYHIPATHTSQRWTYLLIAASSSVPWESQGFFPRRNKHRAASRWCCHLGKLFLEKQEKCVGWAEKTM